MIKYDDCLECKGYDHSCVYSTASANNYCAWYIVLRNDLKKLADKRIGVNPEAVLTFGELETKINQG